LCGTVFSEFSEHPHLIVSVQSSNRMERKQGIKAEREEKLEGKKDRRERKK
jgi:hypothetical protein